MIFLVDTIGRTAYYRFNKRSTEMPHIGKKYYFGWKRTENVVTAVYPVDGNNQYIAWVTLRGPRGGEFRAFVRHDGTCRKM